MIINKSIVRTAAKPTVLAIISTRWPIITRISRSIIHNIIYRTIHRTICSATRCKVQFEYRRSTLNRTCRFAMRTTR